MGGQQQVQPTSNIADSFPGMESMAPVTQSARPKVQTVQLKQPPKWLRRPCGASFGFGGKLVTFEKAASQGQGQPPKSEVKIGNVVTEKAIVERSTKLETSLANDNMYEFCEAKVADTASVDNQTVWRFIKANYEADARSAFMTLLGYDSSKPANADAQAQGQDQDFQVSDRIDAVTDEMEDLKTHDDTFEAIAAKADKVAKMQESFEISTDEKTPSGSLSKALLTGNLEKAVDICLEQNRVADAIILASKGGLDLFTKTQQKFLDKSDSKELPLIRSVVNGDWSPVMNYVSATKNWREALVAAMTYAQPHEFNDYCSKLGYRLVEAGLKQEALLCFICARDLDQVVQCWMATRDLSSGPDALQDLVEVVMTLKSSAERLTGQAIEINTGPLSAQLTKYANILAAQGALSAALNYLGQSNEESIAALRERLTGALGRSAAAAATAGQRRSIGRKTSDPRSSGLSSRQGHRPSWNSGGSGGDPYTAYTGIHNPAVEDISAFQPPVPHIDHGKKSGYF